MNSVPLTDAPAAAVSPSPKVSTRVLYGDGMRICATIGVLWIHVAAFLLDRSRGKHLPDWLLSDVIIGACKWSVPMFIMLSGALLLDPSRQETAETFYRKRLSRIGVPLIGWSGFYLLWGHYHYYGGAGGLKLLAKNLLLSVFYAMPYYHLYFLFILLGLYLFTPLLRIITQRVSISTLRTYALMALLLACGDSMLRSRKGIGLNSFSLFLPYIGYFLLGYVLRYTDASRGTLQRCAAVLTSMALISGVGTFLLTTRWGSSPWSSELVDYLSPTVIPMSAAAFLLLKAAFSTPAAIKLLSRPAVQSLSAATFGIYLVHPFLLDLIHARVTYSLSPLLAFGQMLVVFAILIISSYLATRTLQRIPGLQILTG